MKSRTKGFIVREAKFTALLPTTVQMIEDDARLWNCSPSYVQATIINEYYRVVGPDFRRDMAQKQSKASKKRKKL
jgi:hypothetical protein